MKTAMSWIDVVHSACTSLKMRGKSTLQGFKSLLLRKSLFFPFPRQMYNDLLELIAEGNRIIADYVKTTNIPLQSPYHAYIDKLEFSINIATQKAREIESSYKMGTKECTVNEVTKIIATLKDLIEHKPSMLNGSKRQDIMVPNDERSRLEGDYNTLTRTLIRSETRDENHTPLLISNYTSAVAAPKTEQAKTVNYFLKPVMADTNHEPDLTNKDIKYPAVNALVLTTKLRKKTHSIPSNLGDRKWYQNADHDVKVSQDDFKVGSSVYFDEFCTSKSAPEMGSPPKKSPPNAKNLYATQNLNELYSNEPADDTYDRVYEPMDYLKPQTKSEKRSITSFVTPAAVVSLDRFTSNLYLIPDLSGNQVFVVFGSTHINTIKIYDTQGNDVKEIILSYDWDSHNAYQVTCVTRQRQIVLNEIKGYQITDGVFSLKQRLMFFSFEGALLNTTKRLIEVSQPLESVTVDSDGGNIYVFDMTTLMCVNHWIKKVDKVSRVSVGAGFIACLSDNQVIICNKEGHQKYSWTATCRSSKHFKPINLQVFNNYVYVLGWAMEAWPPNNLLIGYDEEGRMMREIFVPNRIIENNHGEFEFDCGSRRTNAYASNPAAFMLWAQNAVWPASFAIHDPNSAWGWNQFNHGQFNFAESNWNSWNMSQNQDRYDPSWFYATWFAITDNSTAIITNITYDQPRSSSKKIIFLPIV